MAQNPDWASRASLYTAEIENKDKTEAVEDIEDAKKEPAHHAPHIQRAASWDSIFGDTHIRGLGSWYPPYRPCDDAGLHNENDAICSSDLKDCHLSSSSLPIERRRPSVDAQGVQFPSTRLHSQKPSLGVASTNGTQITRSSVIADNHLGIIIRRSGNINVVDDSYSDSDAISEPSLGEDSDSEDHSIDERLRQPCKYFQELDILESKVFANSMFQFYSEETIRKSFNGHTHLNVGYGGSTPLRKLAEDDIKRFYEGVLDVANKVVSRRASSSRREHYSSNPTLDRAIENLFHLIECRNIILWIMESVEAMETASYCGSFISILVIDKARHNVARLLPIECSKIKHLVATFEACLSKLISRHPSIGLTDVNMTFAKDVTTVCRDLLTSLDLDLPVQGTEMRFTEIWRCAVHVLDMAVLSYASAHTQYFGTTKLKYITLPGIFLEKQYFMFRRRSFLCVSEFLGGQEAWVLERYHPNAPQLDLPPLYLSTDAATFGDIWGPMWKSCGVLNGAADYNQILRYNVGNGVIIPWNLPSSGFKESISVQKGEKFCHWISDKAIGDVDNLANSSGQTLHPDNILLIGASYKLQYNPRCRLSTGDVTQRLRDSGSCSELGTMKNKRVVDSETVQIQLGPSYIKAGAQRTFKRRGITWKMAFIESWKNNPEGRNVRMLEIRFGVEVSACTYNARRRRLITLLGSNTMVNYLRNASLRWESTDCQERFYAALKSSDYKAFRNLYKSRKDWQPDLGKAITCCLDAFSEAETDKEGLNLLWVPDSKPGMRVNISSHEHSWVGFLKDTEVCCTMAVLEDKCLELPNLGWIRKCHERECGSGSTAGPMPDQIHNMSVLETSFMLNENCIPKSIYAERCHGRNGSTSRHKHRWSTSLMEDGEKFSFGGNGHLKAITPLGNGQILAHWKPYWDIWGVVREALPFAFSAGHKKRHWEYIRDEDGKAGPIYVLIMSSVSEKVTAPHESPTLSGVDGNLPRVPEYRWVPSREARPRNSMIIRIEVMRDIIYRWERGELASIDSLEQNEFMSIIAALVAELPSRSENSHSEMGQEVGQEVEQERDRLDGT